MELKWKSNNNQHKKAVSGRIKIARKTLHRKLCVRLCLCVDLDQALVLYREYFVSFITNPEQNMRRIEFIKHVHVHTLCAVQYIHTYRIESSDVM